MFKNLVAVVAVGALTFSVYIVSGGTVSEQVAFLADGGIASGNRVATCPVRIDPDCLARARDAGFNVRTNERLRFPVARTVLADGGIEIQMPPMRQGFVRNCIEVKDWSDCTLETNAARPAVAALWGDALPFHMAGVVRKCVRADFDAGLSCLRSLSDGGSYSFGDRNIFPRSEAVAPPTCDSVECTVHLGEDPEVDL